MWKSRDLRLFCLPYSGASAMVYSRWRHSLPAAIEVIPVELPGRGRRFGQPLATDFQALGRQLASELAGQLDVPYALFGHSLGALLAHEVAHALRARGCTAPTRLFASGTAAPTRRDTQRFARLQSDEQLLAELRDLNGTPPELLANAELMALTLPVLRADFALCAHYRPLARPPLDCPIHVLAGHQDSATREDLDAWGLETRGGCSLDLFDGGHFFIHEQAPAVLACVAGKLGVPPDA